MEEKTKDYGCSLTTILIVIALLLSGMVVVGVAEWSTSNWRANNDVIYVFEDGLEPISLMSHDRTLWLCRNQAGYYVECVPEIIEREK
jgi:hypothetical protein